VFVTALSALGRNGSSSGGFGHYDRARLSLSTAFCHGSHPVDRFGATDGGVSRLRPGKQAELIATGIPSAASMCFDPKANQLVIPMNPNNAVAMVKLRSAG
jgi:hypothetical protein